MSSTDMVSVGSDLFRGLADLVLQRNVSTRRSGHQGLPVQQLRRFNPMELQMVVRNPKLSALKMTPN